MKRLLTISLFLMMLSIIVIGCLDNDETYLSESRGIPPVMSNLSIIDTVTKLSYTGSIFSMIQVRQYISTVIIDDGDSDISARLKLTVSWKIISELPTGQAESGTSHYWLYDDGTAGDETAGDHVYTGTWVRSIESDDFTEDVYLYITDNNGNASNMFSARFTFNRYAGNVPVMPVNLASSDITTSSFTLSWDAVDEATAYKIYRNSSYYLTVGSETTSASITSLSSGTSYNMQVAAVNNSGAGEKSGTLAVSTEQELAGHSFEETVNVGKAPWGLAVEANDNYLYVTNWASGTLSIIQRSDHTIAKTISVGLNPSGIAAEPGGQYVYVTNSAVNDSTVSVIEISSNTVDKTITVGNRPRGIAAEPTGTYVYVTRLSADRVTVIEVATNTVDSEIDVGDGPDGITAVLGQLFVYSANSYEDTVSVISTVTNTVSETITVGNGPRAMAAHPAGSYVYAANWYDDTVSVIDTVTNSVLTTVQVGNGPQALAATHEHVYTANYFDDTVSVIRISDNTVVRTINLNGTSQGSGHFGPRSIAVDSSGDNLYIANHNMDNVSVFQIEP